MKKKRVQSPEEAGNALRSLERNNVFASGKILLEMQRQLDHGKFLPWVEEYFDYGRATAYTRIAIAKFAEKFPNIGNLKLGAGALHTLATTEFDQAVIDAVLAEAQTIWVNSDRIWEIEQELNPPEPEEPEPDDTADDEPETEEERKAREAREKREQAQDEIEAAKDAVAKKKEEALQKEAEGILDGEPVQNPPPPQAAPARNAVGLWFNEGVNKLMTATTKPFSTFADDTAQRFDDVTKVHDYLGTLLDIERNRRHEAQKKQKENAQA
jgi:hypothetical protein